MLVLKKYTDYTVSGTKFLKDKPVTVSPELEGYLLSTGAFEKVPVKVDKPAEKPENVTPVAAKPEVQTKVDKPTKSETHKATTAAKPATTARRTGTRSTKTEVDKDKE